MDIATIVAELKQQRERLSRAIAALEGAAESPAARTAVRAPKGRRARGLTAEGRARLSEIMKRRWLEAKKKRKNRL